MYFKHKMKYNIKYFEILIKIKIQINFTVNKKSNIQYIIHIYINFNY